MDALRKESLPPPYQEWMDAEEKLVARLIPKNATVLDAGCGRGRIIPVLAPVVSQLTAVDRDSEAVSLSATVAAAYQNVMVQMLDFTAPRGARKFSHAICMGNTLGALEDDKEAVKALALQAQTIILSVIRKGTLPLRKQYYATLGVAHSTDADETIRSALWGISRAYSISDLDALVKPTGLKICEQGAVASLGIYSVARR